MSEKDEADILFFGVFACFIVAFIVVLALLP